MASLPQSVKTASDCVEQMHNMGDQPVSTSMAAIESGLVSLDCKTEDEVLLQKRPVDVAKVTWDEASTGVAKHTGTVATDGGRTEESDQVVPCMEDECELAPNTGTQDHSDEESVEPEMADLGGSGEEDSKDKAGRDERVDSVGVDDSLDTLREGGSCHGDGVGRHDNSDGSHGDGIGSHSDGVGSHDNWDGSHGSGDSSHGDRVARHGDRVGIHDDGDGCHGAEVGSHGDLQLSIEVNFVSDENQISSLDETSMDEGKITEIAREAGLGPAYVLGESLRALPPFNVQQDEDQVVPDEGNDYPEEVDDLEAEMEEPVVKPTNDDDDDEMVVDPLHDPDWYTLNDFIHYDSEPQEDLFLWQYKTVF